LLLGAGLCLLLTMPLYQSSVLIFVNDHLAKMTRLIGRHHDLALAGYVLVYVASIAFSFPAAILLTLVGGYGFGIVVGALSAAASATLGGLGAFLAARSLSRDWSEKLGSIDLSRPIAALREDAASYLMFLRLMPIFPFWLVNLSAAVARVRVTTFLWTTFFGVMPACFAFATAGQALGDILARQAAAYRQCLAAAEAHCGMHIDHSALLDKRLFLALAALGALGFIPVAVRRIPPIARFCRQRGWIKAATPGEPV
jgi:uncharacterized membrane protein YdjX (TVP38/TMEM64 family)